MHNNPQLQQLKDTLRGASILSYPIQGIGEMSACIVAQPKKPISFRTYNHLLNRSSCGGTECQLLSLLIETYVLYPIRLRLNTKTFGSQLGMSTTYRLQTDGQAKRTIQTLQRMLRTCIIVLGHE